VYEAHRIKVDVTAAKESMKIGQSYSRSVKHRSAITPVRWKIKPWSLQHGIFGYGELNDVIAVFVTW